MWFTKEWRLNRLKIKLAGERAAYKEELHWNSMARECYPQILSDHARTIAKLEEKIRQLGGTP